MWPPTLMVNQNFQILCWWSLWWRFNMNETRILTTITWVSNNSLELFFLFIDVCFSQDALWWDWPTGNWSAWASCRKLSGSTSCSRFYSFGCGRKSEPSSFSRKVENSAVPLSNEHRVFSHRLQTSSLSEHTLDLPLSGGGGGYSQRASW